MAKSRKSRKLNLTEKYERRRIWAGYFGLAFKEMKRATRKALKAIDKAIKQKRLELKQEGVTDIPTVSQVAKYERQNKQLENREEQEREPLPYAGIDEYPYIDANEEIINSFLDTMHEALTEANRMYGMTSPWRARAFEEQILTIMQKFNQIRDQYGDDYTAQKIADSLDYEQIVTTIAYDYDEASSMLDNMSDVFDGILDSM
jgi:hypothetical protein